jgi:hypothetical protein
MPGPEEAFEPVALAPRHNVDVKVKYALAHDVVDRDEGPLGVERPFDGTLKPLRDLKERSDFGRREIGKRHYMPHRDQQNVAGEERPVIEEGN